mmetsp:Transcript_3477/g.7671  ORF Transcript_3477/g.7671 Transcript_3477/m.7671 type:complete len:524 (+) Transcript_3477:108-1679(+)|eukprot:CAMPEP_0172314184 /NCGR_PEP_ID=MMETSP1058-20130122/21897_1 /TAXON_ID=83371 /ORGANISM="Detonula confervacea, Strain CCMP 353" /LENGTH=523 /DNA_ID=CAMNT_0013027983 /DNA_START=25 /DNA_END=1596 /DNA_ORIENTATION=-
MIKCFHYLLVLFVASCGAFNPSYSSRKIIATEPKLPLITRHVAVGDQEHTTTAPTVTSVDNQHPAPEIRLEAYASSGIQSKSELPRVLEAVASVCEEYGVPLDISNIQSSELPSRPDSLPGVLGRVLLIRVHGVPPDFDVDENDLITELKIESSQRIDSVLYQEEGGSNQPVLLAFRPDGDVTALEDVIEREVSDYGLRDGFVDVNNEDGQKENDATFIPSLHLEIDGAMIESIDSPGQTHFDTSSIIVFDNILDDSLRQRLLNIVKGNPENYSSADEKWNDVENGPDPKRWIRGGLMDVVADETPKDDDNNDGGPCWGLTDEAIMDICFNDRLFASKRERATAEFESKLAQLFPDFIVTRLPEAVLGGCVSPLTANAPTHGDTFEYHIDADPLQVPPSPWADVFGRYPNRSISKPRFVSCLLYLNDEWDAESWGAPTQFLDPPTQQTYEVFPQPGRCVFMDQDISHTVVAPNAEAGKRPRYSLVWKLILHPKVAGQDMVDLSCGRKRLWPESVVIGSANANS